MVRRSPFNSVKAAEALRQAVGLTLADNQVTALLLDEAAFLSLPVAPEVIGGGDIKKPIDTLVMLKGRVLVERESLARFGLAEEAVVKGVEVIDRGQVAPEISAAEAVIIF